MAVITSLKPDIMDNITDFIAQNPGCNINRVAMGLIGRYTPNYVVIKIKQMIARKQLAAVISPSHRYSLYLPEQAPVHQEEA